jgi:hypothetical protein
MSGLVVRLVTGCKIAVGLLLLKHDSTPPVPATHIDETTLARRHKAYADSAETRADNKLQF